jgi:hypothetical protein
VAIGAHQVEIMAFDDISRCFQQTRKWFCGVVVTNGRGSPQDGLYVNYTDEEMQMVRPREQKKAAVIGEYGAQVLLDYPSSAVKDALNPRPLDDIKKIITLGALPSVLGVMS